MITKINFSKKSLVIASIGRPLLSFLIQFVQAQSQWSLRRPLPSSNGLLGATYGNGLFVAVGLNNTVLRRSIPNRATVFFAHS